MRTLTPRPRTPSRHARLDRAALEALEPRWLMSSTTHPAYLVPSAPGVETTPLLTVGDSVNGYRMVGIPDGLGAYDNGDGTFTVLMNHELASNLGVVRDHGSVGSFVSKWVIDKKTLDVLSGDDLIKKTYIWDRTTDAYVAVTTAMNRLCSADLPDVSAFYNARTGKGTTARIFMNGEETSNGRAFAHVVTGPEAGTSWELPWAGLYAWENHVPSPYAQDKTIVVGLDDSRRDFSAEGATEPSEVYVWVGQKKTTGLEIDKAGLTDGILHGLRVGLPGAYDANESTVASGERFELVPLSDQSDTTTFQPLQSESIAKSITQFRRVEDGQFDPTNANVFYFVTTDQFGGRTRLWKLTFDDIRNPEAGGKIEIAVDSPARVPGEMFDNMTVNPTGDVLLQEDPGGNPYLAKVWQWDASTGDLIQVAEHNPALFGAPGIDLYPDAQYPQYPGVQGTQDEESSGIIDLSHILGKGMYLADVQAHYRFGALDPELVEAGQLLIIDTNAAAATLADGVLTIGGTINDDAIFVTKHGNQLSVFNGRESLGTFDARKVKSIRIDAGAGSDAVAVLPNVGADALVRGGLGDDLLTAGGGDSVLLGDAGHDWLVGGSGENILIGDLLSLDDDDLDDAFDTWTGSGSYNSRVASLQSVFAGHVTGDLAIDRLYGGGARDWFFDAPVDDDILFDRRPNEVVS